MQSASKTTKCIFDKIQAAALRICCVAMKGTPVSTMQQDCGEMPLHLRRIRQQLQYTYKIKSITDHPTASILQDTWLDSYGKFAEHTEPLHCQVSEFVNTHAHMQVQPVQLQSTPPWKHTCRCYTITPNIKETALCRDDEGAYVKHYRRTQLLYCGKF